VEQFRYLGTALTIQNSIHEEIKTRLKSWTAYYHSVQNLLFSSLLSKNIKIKTFRYVILSVVLYGCETWSFTLREEHRLMVLENMVLRKIFGPKRVDVRGHWRRLHKDGLYAIYSPPNIIRVIKSRSVIWAGACCTYGDRRGVYRGLVGRPDGRRPLGRHGHRWEDNITMDLQETGFGGMEWIVLGQDGDRYGALVNAVMILRVPSNVGHFLTS
jgi:hypothetical protein